MPSRYHWNRLLLFSGFVIAFALFWYAGKWFGIPSEYGFDGSLLRQPSAALVMCIVAATALVCVVVGSIVAGSVRADAALFCTALGLMALSMRSGPIFYTLAGATRGVFLTLLIEQILLFAIMVAGWWLIGRMSRAGLVRKADTDFEPDQDASLDQKLIATAAHACAMITLILVLCRTDVKAQALASVGIASLLASLLSTMIAPTRPSIWYWISPMFVGCLGYAWSIASPQGLPVGQPRGYFAALANPLPLDYASAGVAGAMLGYWFARSWQRDRETRSEPTENLAEGFPTQPPTSTTAS